MKRFVVASVIVLTAAGLSSPAMAGTRGGQSAPDVARGAVSGAVGGASGRVALPPKTKVGRQVRNTVGNLPDPRNVVGDTSRVVRRGGGQPIFVPGHPCTPIPLPLCHLG